MGVVTLRDFSVVLLGVGGVTEEARAAFGSPSREGDGLQSCYDILDSAVLPLINMAAVFSLAPSELRDQLLLLPLPSVGRRLRGGGASVLDAVTRHVT